MFSGNAARRIEPRAGQVHFWGFFRYFRAVSFFMPSSLPTSSKSPRDLRIDFWRGLCLIDMLLVHLAMQGLPLSTGPYMFITEYTRFAAGGFVFMSGLVIGFIYLPKACDSDRRRVAYSGLVRRALFIMGVHYAATIFFLAYYPLADSKPYDDVWFHVREVLLLRSGSDLLPFYAAMLVACPLILELLRRKLWPVLVVGSILLFVWGTQYPYTLALPMGGAAFIAPLWQLIFVAGMLAGAFKAKYDQSRRKLLFVVVGAVAAWTTVGAYGKPFGLPDLSPFVFAKAPLTLGEVIRYLSLTTTILIGTDLCWPLLSRSWLVGMVSRMGRRTLSMYVLHVWVIGLVLPLALRWGDSSNSSSFLAMGVAVVLLAAIAYAMDVTTLLRTRWSGFNFAPLRLPLAIRMPALIAGATLMLIVTNAAVQSPVMRSADTSDPDSMAPAQHVPDAAPSELPDTPDIIPA